MSQIFSYINVVSDGPVLLGARSDVTGDNGERIELSCEVDSNPQALITWTRRGHTQVRYLVQSNLNLNLNLHLNDGNINVDRSS